MAKLYRFQYYTESTDPLTAYVVANSWPDAFNLLSEKYRKIDIKTAEELANENRNLFITGDRNYNETVQIAGFDQFQDPEFRL